MSGAQGWNVTGIDPKVREAAREAAARQGMSLGEYLNYALANHSPGGAAPVPPQRPRLSRPSTPSSFGGAEDDDWGLGEPQTPPRATDPARLAQRLDSIERRTQLAVTGLDRAVSTIDRSVLGLSARIDDAEAVSGESAERVTEALDHFRIAGETLGGKLDRAEQEVVESRRALEGAKSHFLSVRERLESQVAVAEEVARRAEAAASFLTTEMEQRDGALARTLSEARVVAEEAARQAAEASADAVAELRLLQGQMSERLAETETSTRRAVENAIQEVRAETAQETRGTREALLEEVVRLEGEITKRVGAVDQLKSEHAALIARIERAEANARESTAGLRQAAGAAIADLRNAQLTLAARVKQVEDVAPGGSGLTDLRQAQQDIAERLRSLEAKTEASPVADALAAFERRLAGVETNTRETVDARVETFDQALQRMADRVAETEHSANTAIRTLEETVSSINARVEQSSSSAVEETEAVRALLEQRLSNLVGEARAELADQLQAALDGGAATAEAVADVNRRLATAERRQAQTIEAISLEIRRMSETVDKRLRAVEARNDDAAASAVREELTRMAATLEKRFDEIESREAVAFDRMGLDVGRLSERLEERVGAVETRSAQAIEHVGEQVARMAERFNQRQEMLARELGERMLDSEERAGARVTDAIGSIMQRLAEVEEQSAEAIAPVQKAMSSVASKLDRFESARDGAPEPHDLIPTPTRRIDDAIEFDDPEPYVSPLDAAQPLRAGPLSPPPTTHGFGPEIAADIDADLDIYFEEEVQASSGLSEDTIPPPPIAPAEFAPAPEDDLLVEDAAGPFATPQAGTNDFWAPEPEQHAEALGESEPPMDLGPPPALDLSGPPPSLQPNPPDAFEPPPPPGRNDYLASARKAAQTQTKARPEQHPTPRLSLRGSSRIVLWGAVTAVLVIAAGGAWYVNNRADRSADATPDATSPQPGAAAAQSTTSVLQEAAPTDPFAAGLDDAPAGEPTAQPSVMAGPLAPRNVSLEGAAQAGDLTAQYDLGLQRLAAGRTQEGVTLLRRAADRGFAMAQYRMAKLYERGEGVTADLATARQWTERAAAAGNRRAMHDLGVYFARGEGAPLDEAAAFRWFRQAAELGVADSQYNLGVLYQQGRGVNASASEALFWFLVASRQGDQDAGARATVLEGQLPDTQIQQAQARAQAFRPRASSAVANGEVTQRSYARPAT